MHIEQSVYVNSISSLLLDQISNLFLVALLDRLPLGLKLFIFSILVQALETESK